MVAVLRAAIEDACDAAAATKAMAYVTSTDRQWPFSFENICEALDLDADDVRRQLARAVGPEQMAAVLAAVELRDFS